jgi:1-deoxy-D-xylulose-5-phosphate reductoisomerase
MVTFLDGSTIAQASPPDMRLPIALALGWPDRVPHAAPACDFGTPASWTFEPLDEEAFPGVRIARAAGRAGGCMPAMFNASNEEAVAAFVAGKIGFTDITDLVELVLTTAHGCNTEPTTVDEVLAAEQWARARAGELVHSITSRGSTA